MTMKKPVPPPAASNNSTFGIRNSPISQGLRCPRCGCHMLPVYYTRAQDNYILRIRHCNQCARRLLTRERVE
jgi:DNA-directed RNA polymerase subunit RPC12/RpoP